MAKRVSWLYGGKRYYGTLIRETKTHKFARTENGKVKKIVKKKNIVTIIALICSVTLAFGFMKYDVDLLKKELKLKADKRQVVADRELIAYKLDVIMQDIAEIKETLKERK